MDCCRSHPCVIIGSIVLILGSALVGIITLWGDLNNRYQNRENIIKDEHYRSVGGTLKMSPDEIEVNEIIMKFKNIEIDYGYNRSSQHFFLNKRHINNSPIFKIIRMMPKGAALHVRDTSLIGGDFLLNITYWDNLFACISNGIIKALKFSKKYPNINNECKWELMTSIRSASEDVISFDNKLKELFTLEVDNPKTAYATKYDIWKRLENTFSLITSMLTYKEVWKKYFYEALRQYRDDKIMYMEVGCTFPELYDLEGRIYDTFEFMRAYKSVNDKFRSDYPESFGARIIYAPQSYASKDDLKKYIEIAKEVKREFGDFLAGFDLGRQEDKGEPLMHFAEEIHLLAGITNLYYHSRETNWFGLSSDYNLVDAILFGSKRLGHAYALLKHPLLVDIVKKKDIVIEISPLSDQILMLVDDLRNHPGAIMLADNFSVIISSYYPGLWGAMPLSHDFYMAFMGMVSKDFDIRLMKQLALNSIKYSAMESEEQARANAAFDVAWKKFLQDVKDMKFD